MLNLRNGCVALLILGVKSHSEGNVGGKAGWEGRRGNEYVALL